MPIMAKNMVRILLHLGCSSLVPFLARGKTAMGHVGRVLSVANDLERVVLKVTLAESFEKQRAPAVGPGFRGDSVLSLRRMKVTMSDQHFGVVVPGRPVLINFRSLDGLKFVTEVECPAQVTDLTFFLLPSVSLPPGSGVVLYYSLPPFQDWSVMGALTADKPSGVFRTGWSAIEGIQSCPVIQLGVSIESLDVIANLQLQASGVEERRHFAHRIALDLFRFMTSFSTSSGSEMMVVPANVFDKWMQRFEDKFRRDPSFMLKIGGSQEG